MVKQEFKRTIKPGEIKPEQCIYGVDEIGLIYSYFGENSAIYNAMASGKAVSGMIEESIKQQMAEIENQMKLLELCKKREELVESSKTPTL